MSDELASKQERQVVPTNKSTAKKLEDNVNNLVGLTVYSPSHNQKPPATFQDILQREMINELVAWVEDPTIRYSTEILAPEKVRELIADPNEIDKVIQNCKIIVNTCLNSISHVIRRPDDDNMVRAVESMCRIIFQPSPNPSVFTIVTNLLRREMLTLGDSYRGSKKQIHKINLDKLIDIMSNISSISTSLLQISVTISQFSTLGASVMGNITESEKKIAELLESIDTLEKRERATIETLNSIFSQINDASPLRTGRLNQAKLESIGRDLENKLSALERQIADNQRHKVDLKGQVESLEDENKRIKENLTKIKEEQKQLQEQLDLEQQQRLANEGNLRLAKAELQSSKNYQDVIQALETRLELVSSEKMRAINELTELTAKNSALEKQIRNANAELQQVRNKVDDATVVQLEATRLETELNRLKSKLETELKAKTQTERTLEDLKCEHRTTIQSKAQLEREIKQLNDDLQKLRNNLSKETSSKEQEINAKKQLQAKLEEEKAQNNQRAKQSSTLQQQLNEASRELDSLNAKLLTSDSKLATETKRVAMAEASVAELRTNVNTQANRAALAEERAIKAEAAVTQLREEISRRNASVERERNNANAMRNKFDAFSPMRNRAETGEARITELQAKLDDEAAKTATLQQQLDEASNKAIAAEANNTTLTAEIGELRKENEQQREEISRREASVERMRPQLVAFQVMREKAEASDAKDREIVELRKQSEELKNLRASIEKIKATPGSMTLKFNRLIVL